MLFTNMKKYILILLGILLISSVFAYTTVNTIPKDMTWEQYKQAVEDGNRENIVQTMLTGGILLTGSGYKSCEKTCTSNVIQYECNPCSSGEVSSGCGIFADSIGGGTNYQSATSYCSTPFLKYNWYNKQCYCTSPNPTCSGGASPGTYKCESSTRYLCSSGGVWNVVESCTYGCSGSNCGQQQCQSHASKQCSNGQVYWYNSCNQREEIAIQCNANEKCENAQCVGNCNEGWIGSKTCEGLEVKQQFQLIDCTSEKRTVVVCDVAQNQKCDNGECVSNVCNCPDPTPWSDCLNGKMTRTIYECSASCSSKLEEKPCGCNINDQCDENQVCTEGTCTALKCNSDEVISNHECIKVNPINWWVVIGIIVGGLIIFGILFMLVITVGAMFFKKKKSKNR